MQSNGGAMNLEMSLSSPILLFVQVELRLFQCIYNAIHGKLRKDPCQWMKLSPLFNKMYFHQSVNRSFISITGIRLNVNEYFKTSRYVIKSSTINDIKTLEFSLLFFLGGGYFVPVCDKIYMLPNVLNNVEDEKSILIRSNASVIEINVI